MTKVQKSGRKVEKPEQLRRPTPPHCAKCGDPKPMPKLRDGVEPDRVGGATSHEWICGACLYLIDHPDAPRAIKLPRERSKRLQKEQLFEEVRE